MRKKLNQKTPGFRHVLLLEAGGEQPTVTRIPWFAPWVLTQGEYSEYSSRTEAYFRQVMEWKNPFLELSRTKILNPVGHVDF
jgi:hypothetical protein